MTERVYFDTSVFIDIFSGNDPKGLILQLLKELKRKKVQVHTSIITIEEVSIDHFRKGRTATENYAKVHKRAKIEGITREIALTTAKLEANLLDSCKSLSDAEKATENKRRRWDLFHVATAMELGCEVVYCCDQGFTERQDRLGLSKMKFLAPTPDNFPLDLRDPPLETVIVMRPQREEAKQDSPMPSAPERDSSDTVATKEPKRPAVE